MSARRHPPAARRLLPGALPGARLAAGSVGAGPGLRRRRRRRRWPWRRMAVGTGRRLRGFRGDGHARWPWRPSSWCSSWSAAWLWARCGWRTSIAAAWPAHRPQGHRARHARRPAGGRDDQVTLAVRVDAVDGAPLARAGAPALRLADKRRRSAIPCGALTEGAQSSSPRVRVEAAAGGAARAASTTAATCAAAASTCMLEGRFADLAWSAAAAASRARSTACGWPSRAHLRARRAPPVREVLQGMVLGDDEGVDDGLIDDFRRSGLLHIMAVSGENVVLLCTMWAFALLAARRPRRLRTHAGSAAAWSPPTCCSPARRRPSCAPASPASSGCSPSSPRGPATAGCCGWRRPRGCSRVNPNNLFDVSFQLSFGAVAGCCCSRGRSRGCSRSCPAPLPRAGRRSPRPRACPRRPSRCSPSAPPRWSSVPANVAGGFVLGPIMFLGMLSLLLGFVGGWLSAPLNVVAGLFIGFPHLRWRAPSAACPFAVYEWHGPTPAAARAGGAGRRACWSCGGWRSGAGSRCASSRSTTGAGGHLCVATAALLAAVLLLAPAAACAAARAHAHASSTSARARHLGAGARRAHRAHRRRPGAAGPHAARSRACGASTCSCSRTVTPTTSPASRTSIGSIPITRALLPRPDDAVAGAGAHSAAAARPPAPTCAVHVAAGAQGGRGLGAACCPRTPTGEEGNQGENDCALVALVDLGQARVLLPGDCEGEVLAALDLPTCTVVELPHHGSRGGLDAALLAAPATAAGGDLGGPEHATATPRRRCSPSWPPPACRCCAPTKPATWS